MPSGFSKWVPLAPENQLNLHLTLFSGQVFVWKALDGGQEGELYCGVTGSTAFRLRTNAELAMIEYSCWPPKQIEKAGVQLRQFFQLETDIDALYKDWEGRDEVFRAVVHNKNLRGLRVVHQDPFECLVSFITSQNNNVKRISLLLNALRQRSSTPPISPFQGGIQGMAHTWQRRLVLTTRGAKRRWSCTSSPAYSNCMLQPRMTFARWDS
ncbi:8-oxoguanine glycosylase ogg1, partial [Perkinsus olseni]